MRDYILNEVGNNNVIDIAENVEASKLLVDIRGSNNSISIKNNCVINDLYIRFWGDDNCIEIGDSCKITGRFLFDGSNQKLKIGRLTTFERVGIVVAEGVSVSIGEDCMFSYGIQLRTTDAHSIIDLTTGKRSNQAQSLHVGNHVWVGAEAIIQKGTKIPNNSIVGIRSVVSGKFYNNNVAIAGVPAKIVKEMIDWDRKLI